MVIEKIKVRGKTLNVMSNSNVQRKMWKDISQGNWEPQTFRIIDNLLKESDCALEVGIDCGQTSLFTAAKVGRFIAVEPSLMSIEFAKKLFELNPSLLSKTLLLHGALSNSNEKVLFGRGSSYFDEIHFTSVNQNTYVDAYLIEDLQFKCEERITFINMDIEGGEYICLGKMSNFLRMNKPTLLLSMHPGFLLSSTQKQRNLIFRYLNRIIEQRKIFKSIWFYPYVYDAVTFKRITPFSVFKLKYIRSKSAHNSQILCMRDKMVIP